jgi:N-acetylmuramoyl-L-alanine amidase
MRILICILLLLPSQLIVMHTTQIDAKSFDCLAHNIYFEARGEGIIGMQAVADVTMNRVKQSKASVCDVVYKRKQFSWTSQKTKALREKQAHLLARTVAWHTLAESRGGSHLRCPRGVGDSTFYHSIKISPYWAKKLVVVTQVGNHIFYKRSSNG